MGQHRDNIAQKEESERFDNEHTSTHQHSLPFTSATQPGLAGQTHSRDGEGPLPSPVPRAQTDKFGGDGRVSLFGGAFEPSPSNILRRGERDISYDAAYAQYYYQPYPIQYNMTSY